jgi:hypothetical protein
MEMLKNSKIIFQNKMKKYIIILLVFVQYMAVAQDSTAHKTTVKYQINFNATLDKSIVKRLILISNNRFVIENNWTKFEPIINYRFGYVQPNGRPKTDLENDVFILLENHFMPKKKVFPSVIAGFENSPNLRQLNKRFVAGAGLGTYIFKKPSNFMQFNLYGIFEQSDFKDIDYQVFRVMPTLKGRAIFNKNKLGLAYSASFAQALTDGKNYRLRTFVKPFFKISKQIELNMMYDVWQEGIVNGNSPNEISTFTLGLSITNF